MHILLSIFISLLATSIPLWGPPITEPVYLPEEMWEIEEPLVGALSHDHIAILILPDKVLMLSSLEEPSREVMAPEGEFTDYQLVEKELYLLTTRGALFKLNLKTLEMKRVATLTGAERFRVQGDLIAFRSRREVGLTRRGRTLWRVNVGITLKGKPAVDGYETVYVRDRYNRIFAIRQKRVVAKVKVSRASDPLPREGSVYICTSKALLKLESVPPNEEAKRAGLTRLPKVTATYPSPLYHYYKLSILNESKGIWCISTEGGVLWTSSGKVLSKHEFQVSHPPYSYFPLYMLRGDIRNRLRGRAIVLRVERPYIYRTATHQAFLAHNGKLVHLRLDIWKLLLKFHVQTLRDRRRLLLELNDLTGLYTLKEVSGSGLIKVKRGTLFSLTYSDTTDFTLSFLYNLIGVSRDEDDRFWRLISYPMRLRAAIVDISGERFLVISDGRRTKLLSLGGLR